MASHALFEVTITHRGDLPHDDPWFPDYYNPEVQPSPEMELGTFGLTAEGNELCVKVVGANDKAVRAYMFGLDYLFSSRSNRTRKSHNRSLICPFD